MEALLKRKKTGVLFMLIGYVVTFLLFMVGALAGGISGAIFSEEQNLFDSLGITVILIGAVLYFLVGPIGLIIMGPSVDGKSGLFVRVGGFAFRTLSKIGTAAWLLIPFFPIDLMVGAMGWMFGIGIAIELIFVAYFTPVAFIVALVDYFKTKKYIKTYSVQQYKSV